MTDMWNIDLQGVKPIETPITIIEEQAKSLGVKSGGRLVAKIKRNDSWFSVGDYTHTLQVEAPSLRYVNTVLRLKYDPGCIYPTTIGTDEKEYICKDELAFRDVLKSVLSSPRVSNMLRALMSQIASK